MTTQRWPTAWLMTDERMGERLWHAIDSAAGNICPIDPARPTGGHRGAARTTAADPATTDPIGTPRPAADPGRPAANAAADTAHGGPPTGRAA